MSRILRIAAALAVVAALSACGNKGPLVMPQKPVDVPVTPAAEPVPVPPATPPAKTDDGNG